MNLLSRPLQTAALLSLALLTACTGTNEPQVTSKVALINAGGSELRTLTPPDVGTGTPAANGATQAVTGAVDLEVLPGGSRMIVAFPDRLEVRDAALNVVSTLAAPSEVTKACYVRLAASPARDLVAALSDCGNGAAEQLVVYRSDTSLAFVATLPPPTPTSSDLARFTVTTTGAVWLARPATGGGSELLRADSTGIKVVTVPPIAATVNDLAMRGTALYAATDSGVRLVNQTDGTLTQTPVLSGVYTRLYGSDRLLAAWLGSAGNQPLTIWDGTKTGSPALVTDLRDVTFAPDGNVYYLTGTALTGADTVLGLSQSTWRPTAVLTNLNDARALTWLASD
ncbi:hypothetical protein MF271_12095 [Deinococcus sp. KNUC1210]|uniref:hypothetical protein n=1 Tax=Deinococcus sp. KNUC1210 TaxID=2917691 RepID=UPI001EEFD2DC|nr:hypothetical protein [Deinococcus sp. KNUC1210]ULH14736.1 hypothetical protein MF271_12095 [Deinococcus sp. KNUC1210]